MSYKLYKLVLTTLTNLHIGSGKTKEAFDYVEDGGKCHFIDEDLFVQELINKNAENKFTNYIVTAQSNSQRDLKPLLHQYQIDYRKIVKYSIDIIKTSTSKDYGKIEEFIRDGRGNIYVPGSSIKGYINNILDLKADLDMYQNNQDELKKSEIQELSSKILISDSNIIDSSNMVITTLSTFKTKKDDGSSALPYDGRSNYIEFIKPGVKIEFLVKVEEQFSEKFNKIISKIQNFNENYNNLYKGYFQPDTKIDYQDEIYAEGDFFVLGKYTNFLIKTSYLNKKFFDPKGCKTEDDFYDACDSAKEKLYQELKQNNAIDFGKINQKSRQSLSDYSNLNKRYPVCLKLSYNKEFKKFTENGICKYEFIELKCDVK